MKVGYGTIALILVLLLAGVDIRYSEVVAHPGAHSLLGGSAPQGPAPSLTPAQEVYVR